MKITSPRAVPCGASRGLVGVAWQSKPASRTWSTTLPSHKTSCLCNLRANRHACVCDHQSSLEGKLFSSPCTHGYHQANSKGKFNSDFTCSLAVTLLADGFICNLCNQRANVSFISTITITKVRNWATCQEPVSGQACNHLDPNWLQYPLYSGIITPIKSAEHGTKVAAFPQLIWKGNFCCLHSVETVYHHVPQTFLTPSRCVRSILII